MNVKRFYAGIGALALIGGLAACGTTAAAQPAPAPTVTKTITVKVLVPGPAVTVTAPAPASAGVVCFTYGGRAYLTSPGAGVGPVSGSCTIAVTPVLPIPSGQAQIVVTAPDGETGTYTEVAVALRKHCFLSCRFGEIRIRSVVRICACRYGDVSRQAAMIWLWQEMARRSM